MSWKQTFPTPCSLTQSFPWIVSIKVLTLIAEGRVPYKLLGQHEGYKYLTHKVLDKLFVSRPKADELHLNFIYDYLSSMSFISTARDNQQTIRANAGAVSQLLITVKNFYFSNVHDVSSKNLLWKIYTDPHKHTQKH